MLQTILAAPATEGGGLFSLSGLGGLLPIVLMFALLYFMMIRPQKKREKTVQDMRSKLEVGDEIVTVGGIIGIIVNIREDSLVVETGSDRSKIRVARWAVQTNNTIHDATAETKSK